MSQYSDLNENVNALLQKFTYVGRGIGGGRRYESKEGVPYFFTIDPETGDMIAVPESEYEQMRQKVQEERSR